VNQEKRLVKFQDLGTIKYQEAWDYQESIFEKTVAEKIKFRKEEITDVYPENHLLFCEHPPVYTLGKSGDMNNLLLDEVGLENKHIDFHKINRGGDITFHGLGQIVGYPILDLDQFYTDIHKYLRMLEEGIIRTLATYGIEAGRIEGLTGVWLDVDDPIKARKICALGIKCSRWVTMHGFAFNVNTDLGYFGNIIPCGIDDKAVTSMQQELGGPVDIKAVSAELKKHLTELFEWKLI
jgi:lipoyl(octanoyl) transferase